MSLNHQTTLLVEQSLLFPKTRIQPCETSLNISRMSQKDSTHTMDNSLVDAHRAIRNAKSRASEWNVDPERVGVISFFAGGGLAPEGPESGF